MIEKDSGPNPGKDLALFLLFAFILIAIWIVQGGPSKSSNQGLFYSFPSVNNSISSEEQKTEQQKISEIIPGSLEESPHKGKIHLGAASASESDPQKEYIELFNYQAEPVFITGWTLTNRHGVEAAMGEGASYVFSGQVNSQEPISLKSNEKAMVVTGRSPIGTSFKLNICTGYFNQFQEFFPRLAEECPRLSESEIPINYPNACFNFIENLPRCRMAMSIPAEAGNDCNNMINEKINYRTCVDAHKNDSSFYKPEWRIYLNQSAEFWNNEREYIILRDQDGKLVDEISY